MLKTLMPSLSLLVNADYQSIRSPESEQIITNLLKGLRTEITPELRQISGIPGSGKTTFCTSKLPANFLFLSFDNIMTSLKSYQKTLKEEGPVAAYKQNEMIARIIGYEALNRALKQHYNIMFEHSGTNMAHIEMFKNLAKLGYKTSVDFIICPVQTAITRAKVRAQKINRYVPNKIIKERASKIKEYTSLYKEITPYIQFYDGKNNFKPLKEI